MKPKLSTSATVPGGQAGADGDTPLGSKVGDRLGSEVGAAVGKALGLDKGKALGFDVGAALPASVGDALSSDGANVGFAAGSHPDRAALRT